MSEWRLEIYDTFAQERHAIPGTYRSQVAAERAARKRLRDIERTQPSAVSGGQDGIQDRVLIVRPDGTWYRYEPATGDTRSDGWFSRLRNFLFGC